MPFEENRSGFSGDFVSVGRQISQDRLAGLHAMTQQIEKICKAQLRAYLDALAPLFRPRRILGNHMEGAGKENVPNADQNLNDLRELFFKACARPFDLRKELPLPLESVSSQVHLHEWEYRYEVQSDREKKSINVTAPLTWVLGYPTAYSVNMVRQVVLGREAKNVESVRSFLLGSSLMYLMFLRLPELTKLLTGLRYKVEIRGCRELGDLPLVTVSAPVATLLPGKDVLLLAASVSGRPGFVEVIDTEQAGSLSDPLQDQIEQVLASAGNVSNVN